MKQEYLTKYHGPGHLYHDKCIRQWCDSVISGTRRKQNTCPECRTRIVRVPSSSSSDPHSHSQLTKNNTRFKKLILNVKEDVVHSSSPVKHAPGTSPAAAVRNRRIANSNVVESSEESEAEEEEEANEAAAGPSNAAPTGADNTRQQQRENQRIIGEMRALITTKNSELEVKETQLAHQLIQLGDLRNQLHSSKTEVEDVLRRQEICMNELGNTKKEKAQLSRSLEKEVLRHQNTRTALNNATSEISTLKQDKQDLTRRYERLSKINEDHLSSCEDRYKHLEQARDKFEKLHRYAASGNATLKHQNERERIKRKEAEAKLAEFVMKEVDITQSAVKKVDKGKKRMIYQDEDDDGIKAEEDEDDFEVPMASTSMSRSRNSSNRDYDISAEDSLQIDDSPHSRRMDVQDDYEQQDNFDDLDSVHPFTTAATVDDASRRRHDTSKKATWYTPKAEEDHHQKENNTKKRAREDGIPIVLQEKNNKLVKGKGKEKEKEKDGARSQEWTNQVLKENNKNLAFGEKKRSKYFHKA